MVGSLGNIDLMEPEDIEVGHSKLDVLVDALTSINSRGLEMPQMTGSSKAAEIPDDITALDDNELGVLLGNINRYGGYVDTELAKATIAKNSAEAQLKYIRAAVRVRLRSHMAESRGKLTNPDKDDIVETNPEVVSASQKAMYTEAVWLLTKTIRDKITRDWDTISRRITQRGQESNQGRRELNLGSQTMGRSFKRP